MARWKALPAGLDPAVRELVVRLRRMKDDSGLSLPQLAARTGSSASSWERYLAGRTLPPQRAVRALAEIAGADVIRLEVLREAAAEAWQRSRPAAGRQSAEDAAASRPAEDTTEPPAPGAEAAPPSAQTATAPTPAGATAALPADAVPAPTPAETEAAAPPLADAVTAAPADAESEAEPEAAAPAPADAGTPRLPGAAGGGLDGPRPGGGAEPAAEPPVARSALEPRPRPALDLRTAAVVLASAAAGALITLLAVQPWQSTTPAVAATAPATAPAVSQTDYRCSYTRRGGLWYAGNSTTTTTNLVVDMSGPDVAELQCLLARAGMKPGGIDGHFGPLTEGAVIRAQKTLGLGVDGQVGPETWKALRR